MALFWTDSTSLMFLCVYGSQTVQTYSSMGLTRVIKYCALMFLGQHERFLLRKARLLLDFFVVLSTCWFYNSSSDSVTPKYFPVLTIFSV